MKTRIIFGAAIAAFFAVTDMEWSAGGPAIDLFGSPAQARIGRPLTPLSYAGVARRTARRTVRRLTVLPAGCVYGVYYGAHYYRCGGGTYYERSGNTYVQVVIE